MIGTADEWVRRGLFDSFLFLGKALYSYDRHAHAHAHGADLENITIVAFTLTLFSVAYFYGRYAVYICFLRDGAGVIAIHL